MCVLCTIKSPTYEHVVTIMSHCQIYQCLSVYSVKRGDCCGLYGKCELSWYFLCDLILLQLLNNSTLMISPDQQSSVSSTSTATQYFNLDDSISSEFSSTVNQTGLMFMPLEQITDQGNSGTSWLSPTNKCKILKYRFENNLLFVVQVRLRAMCSLHQFPPGTLLANEE